jgi:hypothetical protein
LIVFMTGFFKKLAQGDNALCSHWRKRQIPPVPFADFFSK